MTASGVYGRKRGRVDCSSSDGGGFATVHGSGLGGSGASSFRGGYKIMVRRGFQVVRDEGQSGLA
jgi:hypothetical protein